MRLLCRIPVWSWLLAVTVVGLAAVPARAQERIQVCVVAVLCTERHHKVDPDLKELAQEVRKLHPSLTGYRKGFTSCKSLKVGDEDKFPLVDKEVACVKVQQGMDADQRIQVTVKAPTLGEITYSVICDKYFPLLTRYQTKQGDTLLVAVMVKPCHGKKGKDRPKEKKP